MSLPANKGLNRYSPQVTRHKKPIRHGAYVHSKHALKVRAVKVSQAVRDAAEAMPWIRPEHIPLLRQWAELDEIRRAAFAGLVQLKGDGVVRVDQEMSEVSVRRLLSRA